MILIRFAYTGDCTLGWMTLPSGRQLATIERPWIPAPDHKGGMRRQSCIPDGIYEINPHGWEENSTVRFRRSYILSQPDLDVYREGSETGRYAILIHAGNRVADVIGCIAVGISHSIVSGEHFITRSREAMDLLRDEIGARQSIINIRPTMGTREKQK